MRKALGLLLVGILLIGLSSLAYGSNALEDKTFGVEVYVPAHAEVEILGEGSTFQLAFAEGADRSNSHAIDFLVKRNKGVRIDIDAEPLDVDNLYYALNLKRPTGSYSHVDYGTEIASEQSPELSVTDKVLGAKGSNSFTLSAQARIRTNYSWWDVDAGTYYKNVYLTVWGLE